LKLQYLQMSDEILSLAAPVADRRVKYGADPNQFFDLRLPSIDPPEAGFPLVINIHGGLWRARYDLTHAGHLCAALTKRGLVTANLEYRRVGNRGGGWPAIFDDILAAYDFLVQHARENNIDTAKVLVMGHSAGGQLALYIAAQRPHAGHVISLAGVVDLQRAGELHLGNDAVVELFGGSPSEVPERYRQVDPTRLTISPNVQQFLFHGSADNEVPEDFSRAYAARKQNENVQLISIPGAGHYDLIDPRTAAWRQVEETIVRLLQ
jgi:acetyl esterase/lipase